MTDSRTAATDIAPRPLRVLQVLDTFESGGAQRVALQLSAWLGQHNVKVAVLGRAGHLAGTPSPGIDIYAYQGGDIFAELRALRTAIREFQPDLLHAHQRKEALLSLAMTSMSAIRVVEHAHTYLPNSRLRFLSFRSQAIFAVSSSVRNMVVEEFRRPANRVHVIGNTAANASSGDPVARLAQAGRPLRILAVGRLTEQKDPLRFVRVIAATNRRRPSEGTWVGTGPLQSEAQDLADRIGSPVRFPGESNNVSRMLDSCDGLVLTSRWEGLPLVALEAYARKRPVVATRAALGDEAHSRVRAAIVADDATDDEFASALVQGIGESAEVAARVDAAHRFVTLEATPDQVFTPVLSTYLRSTGRGAGISALADMQSSV